MSFLYPSLAHATRGTCSSLFAATKTQRKKCKIILALTEPVLKAAIFSTISRDVTTSHLQRAEPWRSLSLIGYPKIKPCRNQFFLGSSRTRCFSFLFFFSFINAKVLRLHETVTSTQQEEQEKIRKRENNTS